jgi:hypothetical protein
MATPQNQGIMALPENQEMQAPQLSMMDSYEAMQQGLQNARPDASMELEEALAEIRGELEELTDEQLAQLMEAVQGLYGDPQNYAKEVADMVAEGLIDAEDLPPEYDEEFLSALLMVLVDTQRSRMATAGSEQPMPEAPMGMAPMGMMPPQGFARGGIAEAARMVANSGRRGDTMLAHITPSEARMLMARGGSGTINPRTGLPEFFLKSVFKAVGKTFKRVGKALKKALSSPIGRIIGTIALGMVLGPAVGALMPGLSAATAAGVTGALASGTVTALSGGDLKSILTSAATGFIGAPGGPVGNFVGKYTAQVGITNAAANAAITGAITGTGAGLISGQSLKESLKSGLVEGAISGGTAFMSGAPKVDVDNAAKNAATDATNSGKTLPPLESADIDNLATKNVVDIDDSQAYIDKYLPTTQQRSGAATQRGTSQFRANGDGSYINLENGQYVSPEAAKGMGLGPPTYNPDLNAPDKNIFAPNVEAVVGGRPNPQGRPSDAVMGGRPNPQGRPTELLAGIDYEPQAGIDFENKGVGSPDNANAAAGPYRQVGVGESFGQMGSGAKKFMTGDFSEGASQFAEGAGNLFSPGPSAEQRTAMIDDFMAKNPGKSVGDAIKYVDEMSPGIMRSYGPTVAAGIGALGMAGGFEQDQPEPTNKGPTGMELLQQDPSKYLVQGLPGVQYGAQGSITGTSPYQSPFMMSNIRVPSSYASPAMFAAGGIAALMQGGYPRKVGQISGPGTEKSDSIPAMLSDGEFVMTAKAVRGAGGGSRREGAKRMYALMHQLERNAARG